MDGHVPQGNGCLGACQLGPCRDICILTCKRQNGMPQIYWQLSGWIRWHRQSVRIKEVPLDISWTVFLVRRSVHFTTPFLPAVRTPRSWIGFRHVTPSWTEVQPGRCCSVWGSIKRNESSEDIDTSRSPKGITSYMYVSGSSGGDAATDAATFILSCCDGWEGAIWGGTPRGLLLSNLTGPKDHCTPPIQRSNACT